MKVSLLSNETNSQDPLAVHSRIFVGNLNTFQCSKSDVEQIFQRYGHLTAISMHKGYAFVQFSNPIEAKSAAEGEDGRLVLNQNIDVNLVSQPKIHQQQQQQQQVNAKHVFHSSVVGRHQSAVTSAALKLSNSRFQHLLANGGAALTGTSSLGGGVGVIQPKLTVSIHKRRKRRRQQQQQQQQHQMNRLRTEFLLDNSCRLSPGSITVPTTTTNLMMVANQFSGISPTLSSSSSSSASTSSLASIDSAIGSSSALSSCIVGSTPGQQQVAGEFANYIAATAAATGVAANHQQWYPGCYLSGLNINNNYLIPTPVYDNPNEVIDGSTTTQPAVSQQQQQAQQEQQVYHHPNRNSPTNGSNGGGFCTGLEEEETQEVMFYDGNNNPLSSWQEFILTANKSGPDRGDILICGNCRELFNELEQLLEHRRTACQLRLFCECQGKDGMNSIQTTPEAPTTSNPENTVLYCRLCRKQFVHPLALLQHVQHVHQIKIFETEHDYNPDKDLVAHGEQTSDDLGGGGGDVAMQLETVEAERRGDPEAMTQQSFPSSESSSFASTLSPTSTILSTGN